MGPPLFGKPFKMSLIRLNKTWASGVVRRTRAFSSAVPQENEEYTATPQYPPILDLSFESRMERKLQAKYDAIKNVKTVEEKQIKLNMPRYYGFKCYMLFEDQIPYNSLALAQHLTRTHLIHQENLPDYYKDIKVENTENLPKDIQESLLMEIEGYRRLHDIKGTEISDVEKENLIGASIVKSLNRVLSTTLAPGYPHILDNEVDISPRIEASWVVGGMKPDENVKRLKKGKDFLKPYENDPIDRTFYYLGSPSLTLRAHLPLPYILSPSDCQSPALEVPFFEYDPRVLGYSPIEYKHAASIPGFWPGDSHTFGSTSFLQTGHFLERDKLVTENRDMEEGRHRKGILHSYAWLHAQANHLGFTTYNDITYPLVTQTVLTDGQQFRFYVYQLNTIELHGKNTAQNPKRNVCWASPALKLYEGVENGQIVGLNEDVLGMLARLYVNAPAERLGINLRPYLSQQEKFVADYEDDNKRQWLEKEYKFLTSNRPRYKEMDEIYAWEKIYKIDFESRPTERRRRFFEVFKQPWRRTLDDRLPEYVPRALRPDLPRYKGRRVKEYFP